MDCGDEERERVEKNSSTLLVFGVKWKGIKVILIAVF